ncbi:hypothetical protein DAEQUDRAFT_688512 [Daedalea quercina L-15889]|uniref:BRCT domain-containing protein n=1 Tax=Daedalea quercina L-15889 TaxID=1314783 RepID=A0A165RQY2_9APHY|nr:hypothetical protein DAEQUDRAFT_688512 [Daedalea quercina L-15889]
MAPVRTANRRAHRDHTQHQPTAQTDPNHDPSQDIFIDPMMGTALQIYVEKDVESRDTIVELISTHGGIVSPGYSGVPYVLVDPHKESGQSLFRQYVGKKGKIVLDAKWVIECVNTGQLQTYHTSWAGCKVTGKEQVIPVAHHVQPGPVPPPPPPMLPGPDDMAHQMQQQAPPAHSPQVLEPQAQHPPPIPPPISASATDPLVHHAQHAFQYAVYGAPSMHPPTAAPPQSWQAANGIAPSQTHMQPPPHMMPHDPYRDGQAAWGSAYHQPPPPPPPSHPGALVAPPGSEYDYRYREDQRPWVPSPEYYQPPYEPAAYTEQDAYMDEAGPPTAESSTAVVAAAAAVAAAAVAASAAAETAPSDDNTRGRKRIRAQPQPAPPASTLVVNRRNPPVRSPTPPTRVIKSTYGGNLFTSDDVMYLKKYIDYCQEQGLVLSLREICERIAVKAPHHTFYSWRRYCNKHQIRLGGYAMDVPETDEDLGNGEPQPIQQQQPMDPPPPQVMAEDQQRQHVPIPGAAPGTIAAAKQAAAADVNRTRSPTPPRALFRSTTGKGVAFTDEDVTFLVRFFEYRNRIQNGKVDMVTFWKDVAAKAPHHSRASWMKFYRRHKHELHYEDGDAPLPAPPEKKMRYSVQDDVLLAKYFYHKPEGTSDRVFQDFGRLHPHHPWKGWQEHHRIHKTKIDHLIEQLGRGENIDVPPEES